MAWDLVVADDGTVFLGTGTPQESEITHVTVLREQRLLMIHSEADPEGELLVSEVDPVLMPALEAAAEAIVVDMDEPRLTPRAGWRVPLVKA